MALKDSASAPVVRPAWNDAVELKRLLDAGFYNFLMPFVQTAEDARARRRRDALSARTASAASRSSQRSNRFGTVEGLLRATSTTQICVMVQIESRAGVAAAAEIAAVDGVDGVFVGPSDLAAGFGHLGNAAPRERAGGDRRRSIAAAKAAGKPIGILAPVEADARRYLAMRRDLRRGRQRPRRVPGSATQQLRDRFARSG